MTQIPAAVARIVGQPAPVIIIDTCNFLDLFRRDPARQQPRVPVQEIRIAFEILQLVTARPDAVHLVVPELVPGEFADHADRIEADYDRWLKFHDENQDWLAEAAIYVGITLARPLAVHPLGLQAGFRGIANDLLARAIVLDRDPASLNRAVARLVAKRRPSHNKEIKDSMNLEQSLEFCTRLRNAGFSLSATFISSNTKDYADTPASAQVHSDLDADFAAVSLEYFPNLRSAVGPLRAKGELP